MSNKGHENPYRDGDYQKAFAFWQKKQIVTKAELIDFISKMPGKDLKKATADAVVLLSPRAESKRGDCRGNISARGDLYYAEKLGRAVHAGVKEPQRFRMRWRTKTLERRTRNDQPVKQEKVAEVAKAPAMAVAKVTENAG